MKRSPWDTEGFSVSNVYEYHFSTTILSCIDVADVHSGRVALRDRILCVL